MKWLIDFFKSLFGKKEDVVLKVPDQPSAPHQPAHTPSGLGIQAALSWELPCNDDQVSQKAHPERRAWSDALFAEMEKNYETFMATSDILVVLPDLDSLTKEQRITKLCEMMCQIAKYECSWDPTETSVDTNGRSDPDYLATGMYQLNVEDQEFWFSGTSFSHQQLKEPLNNIKAGVGILAYIAKRRGRITFKKGQPGCFFQTLMFGVTNTREKVGIVLAAVAKMKFG